MRALLSRWWFFVLLTSSGFAAGLVLSSAGSVIRFVIWVHMLASSIAIVEGLKALDARRELT